MKDGWLQARILWDSTDSLSDTKVSQHILGCNAKRIEFSKLFMLRRKVYLPPPSSASNGTVR